MKILYLNPAATSNTVGVPSDIYAYIMPGNLLIRNGDHLISEYTVVSLDSNPTIEFKIGDVTILTTSKRSIMLRAVFIRENIDSFRVNGTIISEQDGTEMFHTQFPLDYHQDTIIKLVLTGNDSIVGIFAKIEFCSAIE